jgi:hypothetical protein
MKNNVIRHHFYVSQCDNTLHQSRLAMQLDSALACSACICTVTIANAAQFKSCITYPSAISTGSATDQDQQSDSFEHF